MLGRAKKKPIEVWATKYKVTDDVEQLLKFMRERTDEKIELDSETKAILIYKKRGIIRLEVNNWLLWEINTDGKFWAIEKEIFHKTYEKVQDGAIYIYRKKSIEIEYFSFEDLERKTIIELLRFLNIKPKEFTDYLQEEDIVLGIQRAKQTDIDTLEGVEILSLGEYLVKGVNGEYYPVTSESFKKVYELSTNASHYKGDTND